MCSVCICVETGLVSILVLLTDPLVVTPQKKTGYLCCHEYNIPGLQFVDNALLLEKAPPLNGCRVRDGHP